MIKMTPSLMGLPVEIRLQIYDMVFGIAKTVLKADNVDVSTSACLIPKAATYQYQLNRSSQLLRVCQTILLEARPVLYAATTFQINVESFAGQLPTTITDGHPCASYIKDLVWQLDCDILKNLSLDNLRLDPQAIAQLECLELRCKADTWRNSYLGEWCDREAFVQGRDQIIAYGRMLQGDDGGRERLFQGQGQPCGRSETNWKR